MTNTVDFEKVAGTTGVNYYYFKTADGYVLSLPDGEDEVLTNPLFTTIIVPTDWDNDTITALGKFNLDIEVEAIQADNNELPDTVVDIASYDDWFNANYTAAP